MSLEAQIRKLKELGLTAEEISQGMGVDKNTVAFAAGEDISEDVWKVIKNRVLRLAATTNDEWLAARLGMFLWEQKRGKPPTRGGNEGTINIQKVNALILAASQRAEEDMEKLINEATSDGGGNQGISRGETQDFIISGGEIQEFSGDSDDGGSTEDKDPISSSFNPPP